jgi:putative oxidoreductase
MTSTTFPMPGMRPSRKIDAGLTILRAVVGAIFIAHGAQKLFVFGFAGVSGMFGQIGLPVPGVLGPAVTLLEFVGGIALLFGVLTRAVALGLFLDMVGAILTVHLKGGFFLPSGIEFALALAGATLAIVLIGGGDYSLDHALAKRRQAR